MPDLLLELFSEEIPARMQRHAAEDLRKLVTDALVEAGLVYEGAKAFVTPRRLALTVHELPARSPDSREEKKGPRVGAPEKAVEGFLKAAGLTSVDQAKIQPDKKGDFYVAVIEKPGRPAQEVIAEIVPSVIKSFPWPKSMRWGERSAEPGSLTWVRPLHSILCTFGPETEEPEVVAFEVDGIRAGNTTFGHRFMAPAEIAVRRFDDYVSKLDAAHVTLDPERRKDLILHDARDQALALGLELVEDDALADEVSGLVEWPVVLVGSFDEAFLELPPEVIRTTIRNNQKCFVLQEARSAGGATGTKKKLANRFVLVANIEAKDGGKEIVAGNERVIRARLADARHFWETDLKPLPDYRDKADNPLDQRLEKLKAQNIVFHEKLGTQGERVERIARLAKEIAPRVGADPAKAERAALLAKADLVTEMVGEFPELQGLMGKYYALKQGEDASVAVAIEDHYKPVGPSDRVPTDPTAIAVALADKLDVLVGFWAIDEKPTGSKDPYALRRAALGVITLILGNALRIGLKSLIRATIDRAIAIDTSFFALRPTHKEDIELETIDIDRPELTASQLEPHLRGRAIISRFFSFDNPERLKTPKTPAHHFHDLADAYFGFEEAFMLLNGMHDELTRDDVSFGETQSQALSRYRREHEERHRHFIESDLLSFFADRLKVQLREQGARADLVDAVFALGNQDDLILIVRRIEALGKFLDSNDGRNLLAGYKRAANILREEEKKSGEAYDDAVNPQALVEPEEKALFEAIGAATGEVTNAVKLEDFDDAMRALAQLRAPVDAFFEKVLVNAPDEKIRANRLRLLNRIREATLAVADFSKVGG